MDLGIRGRTALVTAASRGLGRACAESLAREGVDLVIVARTARSIEAAADEIRTTHGVRATGLAADVTSAEGRAAILAHCPSPDILVCNPGVRQTPGDFRTHDREDWLKLWDEHFHSMIDLIQRVAPGMAERRFGRIVSLSVSAIKFPQVGFARSHAARVGLSGAIASIARELVPCNVTINTVAPGLFDTDALHANWHGHARRLGVAYEDIRQDRLNGCPAGRIADPKECGDLVAFLCSAQAGFIVGQNVVNDGGVYQGLF